jgi:uncharacterized membrane protein YfcA
VDALTVVALGTAAFFAGGINAVAGGGTLIGFPALIAAGYSSKVANVTNTVALWPGTVGASTAYLPELKRQQDTIKMIAIPVVIGALLGSFLLLATPTEVFDNLVPFLILGACALLFFQIRITKLIASRLQVSARSTSGTGSTALEVETGGGWPLRITVFLAAIYGGYFGAGLGIILLALFGIFLSEDIQHANALKGLVAMFVNGLASVYFGIFGDVVWEAALIMAVMSLLGGYLGAQVARRLPRERLRLVAVSYGTIAALVLLVR